MKAEANWWGSVEARKFLKVSDCDLMHLRIAGKIKFIKKGNAFFYLKEELQTINQHHEGSTIKKTI